MKNIKKVLGFVAIWSVCFMQNTLNAQTLSTLDTENISVPYCSQELLVHDLEVCTPEILIVESMTFQISSYTGYIDQLSLFWLGDTGLSLIESKSGFDIDAAGYIDFDIDGQIVDPGCSRFRLFVNLLNDPSFIGTQFSVDVTSFEADDQNNDLVDFSAQLPLVGKDISLIDKGELSVWIDSTSVSGYDKHVLGGAEEFVASYSLCAKNEPIVVEDIFLDVSSIGANFFDNAVSEIRLYDENMQVMYSEVVTSELTKFNNTGLLVPLGDTLTVHAKIIVDLIGSNYNGTTTSDMEMRMYIQGAEGELSSDEVPIVYDDTTASQTLPSPQFDIVAVRVASMEFVSECNGVSIDSLIIGDAIDQSVGILKITADVWENTTMSTGQLAELTVSRFVVSSDSTEIVELSNMTASLITGSARVSESSGASLNNYSVFSWGNGQFNIDTGDNLVLGIEDSVCIEIRSDGRVREDGSFALDIRSPNSSASPAVAEVVYSSSSPSQLVRHLRTGGPSDHIDGVKVNTEFVCPDTLIISGINTIPYKRERASDVILFTEDIGPNQEVIYDAPLVVMPVNGSSYLEPTAAIIVRGSGCVQVGGE